MDFIVIKINDAEYQVKQSFRSLMEFELMTGRNAYEVNASIADSIKLFYCMLKATNRTTFLMDFDTFLDYLDTDPAIISKFNDFIMSLATKTIETAKADKKKTEKR